MHENLPIIILLDEYHICRTVKDTARMLEISTILVEHVIPDLIERLATVTMERNRD